MEDVKSITKVPEASATLRYQRISSSKINIVAKLIRNKKVLEAVDILNFTNKEGARILIKLLNSAIANAENNHYMKADSLYIYKIDIGEGPILKRARAAAKGASHAIKKRTTHVTIILRESN